MRPRDLLLPALALLALLTNPALCAQPAVEGFVFKSDGQPLAKVVVALEVTGRQDPIQQYTTGDDGRYFFDAVPAGDFNLSYTHTEYDIDSVLRLAKNRPQQISKVLYRKGEKRPVTAYHNYLNACRFVILQRAALPVESQPAFASRFERAGIWESLDRPVDDFVSGKPTSQVLAVLYDEQAQVKALRDRFWPR